MKPKHLRKPLPTPLLRPQQILCGIDGRHYSLRWVLRRVSWERSWKIVWWKDAGYE